MAAFEAVERLQKFDWLIQKLHSLRSTFNSEQGLQELQKLHALQLLHRNGIQFNEDLGEGEQDRILDNKMNGDDEREQEEDEELEEIEEDTEVLDEEEDETVDSPATPKSESSPTTTNNTSNASPTNHDYGLPIKNGTQNGGEEISKDNSDFKSDNETAGDKSSPRYGRFPTGLFPPLTGAFDSLLGDDSPIKRKQWPDWPSDRLNSAPAAHDNDNINNNNVEDDHDDDQPWGPQAKRRRSEDHKDIPALEIRPGMVSLPSWFHPPMALPSVAKTEIIEGEGDQGDKEPGITPPLMSPLSSPLPGMASPFPAAAGAGPMDPRNILHLLARKVQKLFSEIASNGKTILIKV